MSPTWIKIHQNKEAYNVYFIFHSYQIIHDIRNLSLLYFSFYHGDYFILALFVLKIITARYFKKLREDRGAEASPQLL